MGLRHGNDHSPRGKERRGGSRGLEEEKPNLASRCNYIGGIAEKGLVTTRAQPARQNMISGGGKFGCCAEK